MQFLPATADSLHPISIAQTWPAILSIVTVPL